MIKRLFAYAKRAFYTSIGVPTQVDIEISTRCNFNCRMCRRRKYDFGDSLMPLGSFKNIIDNLPRGVEVIGFGGYGEMLMHPQVYDMLKYAKSKGYFTQLTSNGALLNTDDSILNLFESKLDRLHISLEHMYPPQAQEIGHAYSEQVLHNLRQLAELRKKIKNQTKIGINTVVYKGNASTIPEIIRFAEELELDNVELIRLDTCQNDADQMLGPEEEKQIYESAEKMTKNIKVITPLSRFPKWMRFVFGQDFCYFRSHTVHIRINGEVTPCPYGFATQFGFGNIFEKSLKEIWGGRKFHEIRDNPQNPVCKSCNIFKQLD